MNRALCVAVVLAISACASGGSKAPPESPPTASAPVTAPPPEKVNAFTACREPARRDEIILDQASRRLHQTVCGAALWFDGLFGERNLEAARGSYGRVELGTIWSEFEGSETRLRFNASAKLPALQRRFSAFIGLDQEDDFVRDRSEGAALRSRRPSDRDEFLAGLGLSILTGDRFQTDLKVGVRDPSLPKVFVQLRLRLLPYSSPENRVLLRLTPFWNNRDRFGVTGGGDYDHVLTQALLFRWSNIGTVAQDVPGLDWRSAFILYQDLRGGRALAYEAFVRGATAAPEPLAEYGVREIYRRPILRQRLFAGLLLGYTWPRDDPALEREGSFEIGLNLELPFGHTPE